MESDWQKSARRIVSGLIVVEIMVGKKASQPWGKKRKSADAWRQSHAIKYKIAHPFALISLFFRMDFKNPGLDTHLVYSSIAPLKSVTFKVWLYHYK